jgi:hypothetical protein
MGKRREREMWVVTRANRVEPFAESRISTAVYYCREGDRKWKPIEDLATERRRSSSSEPNTQAIPEPEPIHVPE